MNSELKPKIRFKGFTDDWEQRKLSSLSRNVGTGKSKYTISQFNKYAILGSRGVIGYDNKYDYSGDFILTARVGEYAGELYRYNGNVKITDNTVYIQGDNLDYLYYLLKQYDLKKLSFGSGQPLVKASELSNLELKATSDSNEKRKISALFSEIDNLITLHQRKCDKLIELKKSLLEKIFPQNNSVIPEIRFKGFTDDWEQRKFDSLARIDRGLTYSPTDLNNNGIRVLRSSNIDENYFKLYDEDVFVNPESINIDFANNNDILIASANGSSRLVGKHAIISGISSNSTVHGGFMLLAKPYINSYFLNASMSSNWYKKFIDLYVAGGNGAIGNLSKTDLDNQLVYVPKESEIIKIGELFKNIDNLITLHQRKHDKLNKIKQSLLNDMFV